MMRYVSKRCHLKSLLSFCRRALRVAVTGEQSCCQTRTLRYPKLLLAISFPGAEKYQVPNFSVLTQCASSSEPVVKNMLLGLSPSPRLERIRPYPHRLSTSLSPLHYRPQLIFTESNQQVIVPFFSRTNISSTSLSHQSSFFSCSSPLEKKKAVHGKSGGRTARPLPPETSASSSTSKATRSKTT
jgi:hypothetical protein